MNKKEKDKIEENVSEQNLHPQSHIQNDSEPEVSEENHAILTDELESPEKDVAENEITATVEDKQEVDNSTESDKSDQLNLSALFRVIMKNWWMILLNCLIFGAIAALLIIEEPRTYTSQVKLVPESEEVPSGGALSSIASSFSPKLMRSRQSLKGTEEIEIGLSSKVSNIKPPLAIIS